MKNPTIILFFSFARLFSNAQNNSTSTTDQRGQYIYENFANGIVLMKSGVQEEASLNYNTADQSIVFEKTDGSVLTLTGLEAIDTIFFHYKKFIPGTDGLIYEVVINAQPAVSLYVNYTNKMKPAIAVVDQNGTSHKAAEETSNTMSGVYVLRPYKGDYLIEIQKTYWLIKAKAKQIYKATSVKQFAKVFPHQEDAIKNYAADKQVNFNLEDDLINLTMFCNAKNKNVSDN